MKLTFVDDARSSYVFSTYDLTPDIFSLHLEYEVGEKGGRAFIPATFVPCPPRCHIHARGKGCGGNRAHRIDANVTHMSGLALDFDGKTQVELDLILATFKAKGYRHWWWNTFKHAPPLNARARVFLPFVTPYPLTHKKAWSHGAWPLLLKHFGLDADRALSADPSCCNPSRLYYLPRKPAANSPHASGYVDGPELDWQALGIPVAPALPPIPEPDYVELDPTRPVDLEAFRERLRSFRSEPERTVLNRLADGRALTPAPEHRRPDEPPRYLAWRTATLWLANLAEGWESPDALKAILLPSYHAEASESPDDHTDLETIEVLLDGALDTAPEWRAEQKAKAESSQRIVEAMSRLRAPEPPTDPDAWRQAIEWREKKKLTDPDLPTNTLNNAAVLLEHHPDLKAQLRYNEYTHNEEVWGSFLLGPKDTAGRPRKESDATELQLWLGRYKLKFGKNEIFDLMSLVSRKNAYDPLTQWLDSCHERGSESPGVLNTWLHECMGVPDSPLSRVYGRKFLISAVARAYSPGCKADVMLVLKGAQGARKSSAINLLGNRRFATSSRISLVGDKDSLMLISRNWLIEAAELDGMSRHDVQAQRAMLSNATDDYRPPYERTVRSIPRRCVFIGTTNEDDFLRDLAGSRRYWVVEVGGVNLERLEYLVPSLWAEAVQAFKDGEQWWLTDDEQKLAEADNAEYQVYDHGAEKARAFYAAIAPAKRPKWVSVSEICNSLDFDPMRSRGTALSNALKAAGFERARRNGQRGYLLPKDLQPVLTVAEAPVEEKLDTKKVGH